MPQEKLSYPPARQADVVDTYHGVRVPDPYRWLEDPASPETAAWVAAENALTRRVLDGPDRDALVERLTALYEFPRTSVPEKRGSRYFFTHNTGLQRQAVLYVQEGAGGEPRALLDPNGTVALTAIAPSDDGALLAYALSAGGSDLQEIAVRAVATGRDRADRLQWVKFATIAWVPDGSGFYYTRFPQPGTVPPGDENYFSRVYYHRLGDPQANDALVFERPGQREVVFGVEVDWHEAGTLGRKQNVFDDFIAAAEWLAGSGCTAPARIAIEGGSNGGLLTGAVMVQRPDLFGAVVCRVPVADMLRYHLFTVGRFWIPEYGSVDDPEQFAYLYRYSPLHNVKDGARYPPILITTADTDDRVAPGMAKKFAARLQAAGGGGPALIRVETKAGHGAGKPVTKIIEEDADIYAFLFKYLAVP